MATWNEYRRDPETGFPQWRAGEVASARTPLAGWQTIRRIDNGAIEGLTQLARLLPNTAPTATSPRVETSGQAERLAAEIEQFDATSSHDVVVETAAGRRNLTEMLTAAARLLRARGNEIRTLRDALVVVRDNIAGGDGRPDWYAPYDVAKVAEAALAAVPAAPQPDTAQFEQAVDAVVRCARMCEQIVHERIDPKKRKAYAVELSLARAALLSLFREAEKDRDWWRNRCAEESEKATRWAKRNVDLEAALTPRKAAGAPTRADGETVEGAVESFRPGTDDLAHLADLRVHAICDSSPGWPVGTKVTVSRLVSLTPVGTGEDGQ